MKNQLLTEELDRILEIMGVNHKIMINEQVSDDIARAMFKRLGINIGRKSPLKQIKTVFSKLKPNQFDELLTNDLKFIDDALIKAKNNKKGADVTVNKLKEIYPELFDDSGTFESYLKDRMRNIKKPKPTATVTPKPTATGTPKPSSNITSYKTADDLFNSSEWLKVTNPFNFSSNQINAIKKVIKRDFKEGGIPMTKKDFEKYLSRIMDSAPPKKLKLFEKYKEGLYLEFAKQFGANVFLGVSGILIASLIIKLLDCLGEEEELIDTECVFTTFGDRIGSIIIGSLKGFKEAAVRSKKKSSTPTPTPAAPSTGATTYTNDKNGFMKWCIDNNISGCDYDSEYNEYYDLENYTYYFKDNTWKKYGK